MRVSGRVACPTGSGQVRLWAIGPRLSVGRDNSQEEAEKLVEVNELLWLFRGRPDRIPKNAHAFIDTARRYINE